MDEQAFVPFQFHSPPWHREIAEGPVCRKPFQF